jgi:hypothetical protein
MKKHTLLRLGMMTNPDKKLRGTMDDPSIHMIKYEHDGKISENVVTWHGKPYEDARTYYDEVVMTMPRKDDDTIVAADEHLGALCILNGSDILIMEDENSVHVDRWRINADYITHKHPEFGRIEDWWEDGYVQVELQSDNNTCGLCGEQVSGEIKMMHDFYRMG